MIKTILFQGDSISDALRNRDFPPETGRDMGCGFVALTAGKLLAANLDNDLRCINRGNGGNRVVDLYSRWKIDALNLKPDMISILVGVNDSLHEFKRQNGVELPRFEQIYRMLLEWTRAELPEVRLVLCEPFCMESEEVSPEAVTDIAARGRIVEKLAAEFDAVFVPLQDVLNEAAEKAGDKFKILWDGVHPTLVGAQIISDQWLKYVEI